MINGFLRVRAGSRSLLGLCFLVMPFCVVLPPSAHSDEESSLAALRQLGAEVQRLESGGLEIEFHRRGRSLTDAGLAKLAKLTAPSGPDCVVSLKLRDTKITAAGLVHLKGLTSIRWLHLERTAVNDKGTEHLAALKNLEYLNLYGTKVSDKTLVHLKKLKSLRRIYLWQTKVSDVGVAQLQKALPKLKISRGVDLDKVQPYVDEKRDQPKPTEDLEWMPVASASDVPKSQNGLNTQVYFENKSGRAVKLYWKSYGGPLQLYAKLDVDATRQQNSYSRNTWVITDLDDNPLGYFLIGEEVGRAVIPKPKPPPKP